MESIAAADDLDEDGIPDAEDDCPDQPEDRDQLLDGDGCPELDADLDGVLDECDRCPLRPETYNYYEDEDGCWDCALYGGQDGVLFETNQATLDDWSIEALEYLAKQIIDDTSLERVAIVGRAAPGEARPRRLSEWRARAVYDVLTSAGVAPARLQIVVRGDAPVKPDGRDRDILGRRTALVVVRKDGQEIPLTRGRVLEVSTPPPDPPRRPDPPACPLGPTPQAAPQ